MERQPVRQRFQEVVRSTKEAGQVLKDGLLTSAAITVFVAGAALEKRHDTPLSPQAVLALDTAKFNQENRVLGSRFSGRGRKEEARQTVGFLSEEIAETRLRLRRGKR